MPLDIRVIPCLSDNYAVLLHDPLTEATAVVDAPEPGPIMDALEREGWDLTHILITHHHSDHVDGVLVLKAQYGATVVGPKAEAATIPGLDVAVVDADPVGLGSAIGRVIETPGHTAGHISFVFPEEKLLFAGDTLFVMGCGRALECDPPVLWHSLQRLRTLPDDFALYCGHEYTVANGRFALSVDPDNGALRARVADAEAARREGKPTIPALLGDERLTNPFLRADDPDMAERLGLAGADPAAVFTELRARKNVFRG